MIIPGHKDGCLLLEQPAFSSKVAFFLRMSDLHFPLSFFSCDKSTSCFFMFYIAIIRNLTGMGKSMGKSPHLWTTGAIDTVPSPWVSNGLTSLLAVVRLDDLCGSQGRGIPVKRDDPPQSCETWCWCHKNVIDLTWMDQVVKLSSCQVVMLSRKI